MMRPKISDDRGRPVRLCSPTRLPSHAPDAVRRSVNLAYLCSLRGVTLTTLVALFAGGATSGFVNTAWGSDWWGYPAFLMVGGIVGVCVLVLAGAWGVFAREPIRGAAKRACLAAGVCPSCMFGIAALAPDVDGCVTCPECEAAWMVVAPDRGPAAAVAPLNFTPSTES